MKIILFKVFLKETKILGMRSLAAILETENNLILHIIETINLIVKNY